MANPPELNIGPFLLKEKDFSNEEKKRIAGELKKNGLIQRVFFNNAKSTALFKHIVKDIKVRGHSPGRPDHANKALKEVLVNDFTKGTNKQKKICWTIYKDAIAEHLGKKQKKLNKLLLNVPLPKSNPSYNDILKLICNNAKLYTVTPDSIEELYKLWGFDRVDNLKDLLSLCSQADPLAIAQKKISELEDTVDSLKQKSKAHDEEFDTDSTIIGTLRGDVESLNKSLEKIQTHVDKNTSSIESLSSSLKKEQADENKEINKRLLDLETSFSKLKPSIDELFKNFSTHSEQINKSINSKLAITVQSLTEKISENIKSNLNYIDSKIEKKFDQLENKPSFQSVQNQVGSEYKSPLNAWNQPKQTTPGKIKDEWLFINIWQEHLKEELELNWSVEYTTIIHILFKSSNTLVLCNDRVFRCWLNTLEWHSFNYSLVTSPNWLSESDWGNGAHYLFDDANPLIPKILTLYQYNVGLPSSYLIPSLKLWDLRFQSSLLKIALIESDSQDRKPDFDLLEFGTYLNDEQFTRSGKSKLPKLSRPPRTLAQSEKHHTGVNIDSFKSWIVKLEKKDVYYSDIDTYADFVNISLPFALKVHYMKISKDLSNFFSTEASILISAHHVINPWIEGKHGEDCVEEFVSAIKKLSGEEYQ